jgi:hypothetical protein
MTAVLSAGLLRTAASTSPCFLAEKNLKFNLEQGEFQQSDNPPVILVVAVTAFRYLQVR